MQYESVTNVDSQLISHSVSFLGYHFLSFGCQGDQSFVGHLGAFFLGGRRRYLPQQADSCHQEQVPVKQRRFIPRNLVNYSRSCSRQHRLLVFPSFGNPSLCAKDDCNQEKILPPAAKASAVHSRKSSRLNRGDSRTDCVTYLIENQLQWFNHVQLSTSQKVALAALVDFVLRNIKLS